MSSSSSGITSLTRPSSQQRIDPVLDALMRISVSWRRWRPELVVRELARRRRSTAQARVEIGNCGDVITDVAQRGPWRRSVSNSGHRAVAS